MASKKYCKTESDQHHVSFVYVKVIRWLHLLHLLHLFAQNSGLFDPCLETETHGDWDIYWLLRLRLTDTGDVVDV